MESRFRSLSSNEQFKYIDDQVKNTSDYSPIGSAWYVVSMTWWYIWEKWSIGRTQEDLQAIDNGDILMSSSEFLEVRGSQAYENTMINRGMTTGANFHLVSERSWKLLCQIFTIKPGHTIKRFAVSGGRHKVRVEVHLSPILFTWVEKIGRDVEIPTEKKIYVSGSSTVADLKARICEYYNSVYSDMDRKPAQIRMLKLAPSHDIGLLSAYVKSKMSRVGNIEFPGVLLLKETIISDAEISSDDLVIAEMKEYIFQIDRRPQSSGPKPDQRSQLRKSTTGRPYLKQGSSKLGKAGLKNLGNTCYMNAILQCLSNCPAFVQYFINDQYLSDLNLENPQGTRGEVCNSFAKVMKELWLEDARYFAPWKFKRAIGSHNPTFAGMMQNDAQEFLNCLLDALHEDLNNPIGTINPGGSADPSSHFWDLHKSRNSSIVHDLF